MDALIRTINELQDAFATVNYTELNLPQIVVVGAQSSGKSSVLESFVGRDFLPRGSGIVTRRPLVLQLIQEKRHRPVAPPARDGSIRLDTSEDWGEFLHTGNAKFTDFEQIRAEIIKETDRVTGANKGISPKPIRLTIHSPNVLNLTLVDLPGITKVPVGDQPKDIEKLIVNMIRHFVENPNSIILAVTAANTDIANSDALKLASRVDPQGTRTLGVLTKLDLMDSGTNCMDVLTGQILPLRLGYVGLVNRSQHDINTNEPMSYAREKERQFFREHPNYSQIANRLGTPYLAKTLNALLLKHIRNTLPEIKHKIQEDLIRQQKELALLGDQMVDKQPSALLLNLLQRYADAFRDAVNGRAQEIGMHELQGGARISHIFTENYMKVISEIDPCEGLSGQDIRTAMKNSTGPRPALFVSENGFELLVRMQVHRLEAPSSQCAELVLEELLRIALTSDHVLQRFPTLRSRVTEVATQYIRSRLRPTTEFIHTLVEIDSSYVNTAHPDFVGGTRALHEMMEKMVAVAEEKAEKEYEAKRQQRQIQQAEQAALQAARAAARQHQEMQQQSSHAGGHMPASRQQQQQQRNAQSDSEQPDNRRHGPGGLLSNIFGGGRRKEERKDEKPAVEISNPYNTMHVQGKDNRFGPVQPEESSLRPLAPFERKESIHLNEVPGNITMKDELSRKEHYETEMIRSVLYSYFDILRQNMMDTIPKDVMHLLVNNVCSTLESVLVRELYQPQLLGELLEEDSNVAGQREALMKRMSVLKAAATAIARVDEMSLA